MFIWKLNSRHLYLLCSVWIVVCQEGTDSTLSGHFKAFIKGPEIVSTYGAVTLECSTNIFFKSTTFRWHGITCLNRPHQPASQCTFTAAIRLDGTTVTCTARRYDGTEARANYTFVFAYGPSRVSISGPRYIDGTHLEKSLTLRCSGDIAYPNVSYFWSSDAFQGIPGDTLSFKPSQLDDGKMVKCSATNTRDRTKSVTETYYITVAFGPTNSYISEQPSIEKPDWGKYLTLHCSVDDVFPNVTYSWVWPGNNYPMSNRYTDNSRVTFVPSTKDDGKNVTCIATNTRDTSKMAKATYQLNIVYGPFNAYIAGPLYINKTHFGHMVTLSCSVDDVFPNASFTWSWRDNREPSSHLCSTGNLCRFPVSLTDDGKTVTCTVTNTRDTRKLVTKSYHIRVAYGPYSANFSGPPFINKTQLGKELLLSCSTDDVYPNVTYSWNVTGTSNLTTSRCSSGHTCLLTPLKENDGTTVTCIATNERDVSIKAVHTYKINVAYGPSSVVILGPTILDESILQTNVTLTCRGDDVYPRETYNWSWHSNHPPKIINCHSENKCIFEPTDLDDGKEVMCSATNSHDVTVSANTSYLMNIAYITGANISGPAFIVTDGTKTETLQCSVTSGFPGVNFSWDTSCDEIVTSYNGSTCSITPAIRDDGKIIKCKASNTRFESLTTSTSYNVSLKYPPSSSPQIESDRKVHELQVGSNLTLTCSVSGGKPPVSYVNFSCRNQLTSHNSSHENTTSSTIVINLLDVSDDGTACYCSAFWEPEPGYYQRVTSLTLTVVNSTVLIYFIIGGAVGATALCFIVIIVVSILIIKRKKKSRHGAQRGARESLSAIEDHDHDLYEIAVQTPNSFSKTGITDWTKQESFALDRESALYAEVSTFPPSVQEWSGDVCQDQNNSSVPPSAGDAYARVNKGIQQGEQRDNRSLPEPKQPVYAQPQKVKPANERGVLMTNPYAVSRVPVFSFKF